MESNGPNKAQPRATYAGSFLLAVPEREMDWKGERVSMPEWHAPRAYILKEEVASPTVSTESTFIMASIAASERRAVQCYNVPS